MMSSPENRKSEPAFPLAVCAEMVFLDLPFEERVRRIDDLGFAVEIWFPQGKDIKALAATGATFSSMAGYLHGNIVEREDARTFLKTAEQTLEAAAELGCPRLVVHPAELVEGKAAKPMFQVNGEMWLTALRTLEKLAQLGEQAGVTYCLENLNTIVDHPGVPIARAKDTLALVEAVGSPHVRMMLDLYHAQIGEGNLISLIERADGAIGEVQVADVPGRCEPGTGEIYYPAVARALKRIGYKGTVGLEAYASGDDTEALARFREAFTLGQDD
ncbi:2-oxo-tetronate isomerase [Rubrobacter xylanophilus DSM 9941]|uniref:TIM barrel protein n=1 Tax=Rubrobacter xylanophilus TaxID=49319 RepID=UPI001C640A21|nr:TIM barrel protein [Rubrobacter xylanophilus]QYJ14997.1 2-oxo-tetronate isomerase [Rubrobacter xylanophilus DSM 9941]